MSQKKPVIKESDTEVLRKYSNILNESVALEDPESYKSWNQFKAVLAATPIPKIVNIMNKHPAPVGLFPSGWGWSTEEAWGSKVPYPAKLAEALVKSNANESFTDLANIYYGGRKYTPMATAIFRRDAIANGKNILIQYGLGNGYELVKHEPETMKKIFLTMTPAELERFKQAEDNYGPGRDEIDKLFRAVGIIQ